MPEENRNIAKLVRNSDYFFSSRFIGLKKLPKEVMEAIPELYDSPINIPTKKGQWQLYMRENFSIPFFLEEERVGTKNGFCAVYERKNYPITLFLGDLKDKTIVEDSIDVLTNKVLEQKKWFAWPPRKLSGDTGHNYGINKGFLLTIGISLAPLIDEGLSHQLDSYDGIISNIFHELGRNSPNEFAFGVAGGVVGLTGNMVLLGYLGEKFGPVADKKRTTNLPEEAFSYLFGKEAEAKILEEESAFLRETKKAELYEELKKDGGKITKQTFAKIYEIMGSINKGYIYNLSEYLQRDPEGGNVPLEKVVNVFSM